MASETTISSARKAYLLSVRRRERFIIIMRYAILIGLVGLWELAARVGWIDPFITSCRPASPQRWRGCWRMASCSHTLA